MSIKKQCGLDLFWIVLDRARVKAQVRTTITISYRLIQMEYTYGNEFSMHKAIDPTDILNLSYRSSLYRSMVKTVVSSQKRGVNKQREESMKGNLCK